MKKDKNIEKKLDELSNAQDVPKLELLLPAIDELKRQNSAKQAVGAGAIPHDGPAAEPAGVAARSKTKRIAVTVVAALIVLAIITAIAVPQILEGITRSRTFALNALETSHNVTAAQKELFPTLTHATGEAVFAEYTVLSKNDETVAVQYKARRLTKYTIDNIVITAETGKYFVADYQPFAKYETYNKRGSKYRYDGYYEGGEYCADYYANAGDVRYYVSITSPKELKDDYYLDKILEKI